MANVTYAASSFVMAVEHVGRVSAVVLAFEFHAHGDILVRLVRTICLEKKIHLLIDDIKNPSGLKRKNHHGII